MLKSKLLWNCNGFCRSVFTLWQCPFSLRLRLLARIVVSFGPHGDGMHQHQNISPIQSKVSCGLLNHIHKQSVSDGAHHRMIGHLAVLQSHVSTSVCFVTLGVCQLWLSKSLRSLPRQKNYQLAASRRSIKKRKWSVCGLWSPYQLVASAILWACCAEWCCLEKVH